MKLLKKKKALVKTIDQDRKHRASKKNDVLKVKKEETGSSLLAWVYQPALMVLIVFVLTLVLVEFLFIQQLERQNQATIKSLVTTSVKQNIDAYIAGRALALKSLAGKPGVQSILFEDSSALPLKTTLQSAFPEFEKLYVTPSGELSRLSSLNPELSFASIDLIRRTVSKQETKPEAFLSEDSWKLQIAVPVIAESGEVTGAVMGIFNLSGLKPFLVLPKGLPSGKVSLVSNNGVRKKVVISNGEGEDDQSISVPTSIPQWTLNYAPLSAGSVSVDRMVVWIIFAVNASLLAVVILLISRLKMHAVRRDLLEAADYLKRLLAGEGRKVKAMSYGEIHSMVMALAKQIKSLSNGLEKKSTEITPGNLMNKGPVPEDDGLPLFDDDLLDLDELSQSDVTRDVSESNANIEQDEDVMVKEIARLDLDVPQSIFRAYDIRGIVDETLNEGVVELIGKAIASEALARGKNTLCVGYDGRLSSVDYCEALTKGIISTGVDVIVIGQVPTPLLYFATHHFDTGSGVMITGSHNPSNYNGFKMMIDGKTLANEDIQKIYNRIILQDFSEGQGSRTEQSIDNDYIETILSDIAVASPLKVVLDAGNGVAGGIAPDLIEELGCEVIPIFCEVDGNFPNHHPDPGKPENLQDLIAAVKEHDADIGLAFDGDGDRIGVVTNTGKIIWPDRLLMLFAKDVVSRNPGADIIFDVKCSRRLNGLISGYGGRPIMWKTGHSLIKAKMKETGALLAGEMSGHVFFKERWYGFDDGLYSAARLLEILGVEDRTSDEVFASFPEDVSTPEINIAVTDESKFSIVEKLCALKDSFAGGNVSTIDGLRVDYPNGWGLCRASNTTPMLVLRFEADDESALQEIKDKFIVQLRSIDPELDLNI